MCSHGGHIPCNLCPTFLHQESLSGTMKGFEQAASSTSWWGQTADGDFRESRGQTPWETSTSFFSRGFPCPGGGILHEMSFFLEFKVGPGGGVRALNPHFRPVLPIWHHQQLRQVAVTHDIYVPGSSSLSQDPAWFFCFPIENRPGRRWKG